MSSASRSNRFGPKSDRMTIRPPLRGISTPSTILAGSIATGAPCCTPVRGLSLATARSPPHPSSARGAPMSDDRDLVNDYQDGSESAAREIFDKHCERLLRLAKRRIGQRMSSRFDRKTWCSWPSAPFSPA